jgi:hypothetical protein
MDRYDRVGRTAARCMPPFCHRNAATVCGSHGARRGGHPLYLDPQLRKAFSADAALKLTLVWTTMQAAIRSRTPDGPETVGS